MPFWRTLIFGQSSYHINLTRPGSELWLNINAANFKAVSKESSVAVCFPLCPLSGYVFCMLSILNHNLNRVREIFRKYRCKSVQFGALWGHQVIKSGTENIHISAPLVKVGRNLPFLPYRFRGPCFTYSMSKLCQSALLVTKLTDSNPNSSLSCAFIILSLQHIHLILLISVLSNFAACATSVG